LTRDVQSRALLAALLGNEPLDLRRWVRQAPVVPDTVDALDVLNTLRHSEVPIALVVHNEYGHFEGIVTPADILDAIAGAFRSDVPTAEVEAIQREDGSWLVAGSMPADDIRRADLAERGGGTIMTALFDAGLRVEGKGGEIWARDSPQTRPDLTIRLRRRVKRIAARATTHAAVRLKPLWTRSTGAVPTPPGSSRRPGQT
jgi:hypothetical protein